MDVCCLEFIKDTALPGMLSTERMRWQCLDPMTALALSSMVTEFDRDEDGQLNLQEFEDGEAATKSRIPP